MTTATIFEKYKCFDTFHENKLSQNNNTKKG